MEQYNSDAPRTFFLNLKLHPEEISERKLKWWLKMIKGVHSVDVNAQQRYLTITGTVDPATIVMMLNNYGINAAELLLEQGQPKYGVNGIQETAQSKMVDQLDDDDSKMVEKVQQLSAMENTQEVVLKISKTIKVINFDGQKNKESATEDKDVEVNTRSFCKDTVDSPQIPHGGCCGLCVASASCCGGHGMHNFNGHHCPIHSRAGSPPDPAPSWPVYINPSAPPLSYVNSPPPPPPPPPQPYYSVFSDENPNACSIL